MPKGVLGKKGMQEKVAQYLKQPYARLLIRNDDGSYTAEILEFPGCISQGDTAQEAIENLEDAAQGWIEVSLEDGRDIPPPSESDYSGRVLLRLPKSLHQQAARMAQREGSSLNQFIVTALSAAVGISDFYNRMEKRLEEKMAPWVPSLRPRTVFYTTASISPKQLGAWRISKPSEIIAPPGYATVDPMAEKKLMETIEKI